MNDINLVSGKNLDFERKQVKTQKILKISAIISLFTVAFISIFFFIITLLLPTTSVKKDQAQTLQGISGLHKKLVTHALVKERLKNIEGIILLRKDYPLISNEIVSKLPSDMSVDVMNLQGGNLIITVSGPYLLSINQFIDDFIFLSDNNSNIMNLTVQSLIFNTFSSNYSLTFQADIL
jgi:hypothetical protein